MPEKITPSENLRKLAGEIRRKQNAAAEIAAAFELIAEAMEPCIDCGHQDNPATGADVGMGGLDNTTAAAQGA